MNEQDREFYIKGCVGVIILSVLAVMIMRLVCERGVKCTGVTVRWLPYYLWFIQSQASQNGMPKYK